LRFKRELVVTDKNLHAGKYRNPASKAHRLRVAER